jgi:PAS domain S-box-containing protein
MPLMTHPSIPQPTLPPGFEFEAVLSEGARSTLVRARDAGGRRVLLRLPPAEADPVLGSVASPIKLRFARVFALRTRLDPTWALMPLEVVMGQGGPALVLSDPGGAPTRVEPGGMEWVAFFELARGAARALAALHATGLIHRGLEPDHIWWNPDEKIARLTGFGATGAPGDDSDDVPEVGAHSALEFMAPEQTGRMDRAVDTRSDLYSLGVVFYEFATGAPPFDVASGSEWPHAHVARAPVDPRERRPDLPPMVAEILLKLLAKASDERYQSARGLAADLDRCFEQWSATGTIRNFPLATRDPIGRFVPRRLHGRASAQRALREAFASVVRTRTAHLLLVAGEAGSGKSTLVRDAREEMDRTAPLIGETSSLCGHRFASGKFEEDRGEVPHTAIVQALDGIVRQILTEPESELAVWQRVLAGALAPNAALIVDWLPVVGHLLGHPEPPPPMPAQEAKNRFFATVRTLVETLAQRMGPMLIFLDDLQWLDPGSAELLEVLLSSDLGPVLFVGAYRPSEVGQEHPLRRMTATFEKNRLPSTEIEVQPLSTDELASLVGELLSRPPTSVHALARLLRLRGGGNPFVALRLLARWRDEGLLHFDDEGAQWRWDESRIEAETVAADTTGVILETLLRLAPPTRAALGTLAGFGSSAPIVPLAQVLGETQAPSVDRVQAIVQTESALEPAVISGLVVRTRVGYAFAHDRIREAAYTLVPEDGRVALHLRIARIRDLAVDVFVRANRYNRGLSLVTDPDERRFVQRLNEEAGRKAKQASAFASARRYFAHAYDLRDEGAWSHAYSETRALLLELGECTFLSGDSAGGDRLLQTAGARSRSRLDGLEVESVRVALLQTVGRFQEALTIGRSALAGFGVTVFDDQTDARAAFAEELQRHEALRAGRPIEAFADLPLATDREVKAFTALVADLTPALYLARLPGLAALILRCVNRTLESGLVPQSATIFGYHALLLAGAGEYAAALAWADFALLANQRGQSAHYAGRVHFLRSLVVAHWRRPFVETMHEMDRALEAALQVGDLAFVSYVGMGQVGHWIAIGRPLDEVLAVADRALAAIRKTPNPSVEAAIRLQRQFVFCLKGRTHGPLSFSSDEFDEDEALAITTAGGFTSAVTGLYVLKAIVAHLHDRHDEAVAYAAKAQPRLQELVGAAIGALHPFFHALIVAAPIKVGDTDPAAVAAKRALADALAMVRPLAAHCPENFLCRKELLEAETARIEGRALDAMRGYDAAIAAAHANDLVLYECVSCEAAARFHFAVGLPRLGQRYLRATRSAYGRWGADAKLASLSQAGTWSSLAVNAGLAAGTTMAVGASPDNRPGPAPSADSDENDRSVDGVTREFSGALDLAAIMRASLAMSEQMQPARLIEALLTGVLAMTRATRAALIVSGTTTLEIHGDAVRGQKTDDGLPVVHTEVTPATADRLAESVVHQAFAIENRVLGAVALEPNLRAHDEYLRARPDVSATCQPLIQQGALVGMLYLEAHGELPHGELTAVGLLAAQAAISLRNARLYSDLVDERSRLQAVIQQVPAGLIISEAATGRIVVVNDEGRRLLRGLLLHPQGKGDDAVVAGIPESLETSWFVPAGWPLAASMRGQSTRAEEIEIIHEDGEHTWLLLSAMPRRDSSGNINSSIAILQDITDRKLKEEALRRSEQRFSRTFHNNPTPMSVVRLRDETIVDVNEAFLRMLGHSRESLLGKSLGDTVPWLCRLLRNAQQPSNEGGSLRNEEVIATARAGDQRTLLVSSESIWLDRDRCHLATYVDVTERKRAEEQLRQLQKTEAIGSLAGGITHDFNNLLTAINGYSGLLLGELSPTDPNHELVQAIRLAGERASALTQRLAAFSRKEALKSQVVVVNRLVEDMEGMLVRLMDEQVRLVTRLSPEAGTIRADRSQIDQVLMNLVVNARDAMPSGGEITIETARIVVSSAPRDTILLGVPGPAVMLAVTDTGVGMTPEVKARICEPFFTTKGAGKGTGLGLAVVYEIVKRMRGWIAITSAPGHGTTFQVYFPEAHTNALTPAEVVAPEKLDQSWGDETILVVEDEESVRRFIERALGARGYRIVVAKNGRDALSVLQKSADSVDLLLTDLMMPDMGGRELSNRLRVGPGSLARQLPILFMSGSAKATDILREMGEDPSRLIGKPFGPSDLARKVREILDRQRRRVLTG